MSDYPYPLALQPPRLDYVFRSVCLSDVEVLQACLWQDRDEASVEDFIKRVLRFQAQQRGRAIVVVDESRAPDAIIAYGQITQWVSCAEISDLMVTSDYQCKGIGTTMIQLLTQYMIAQNASCVELGVAESNPRALDLYRRLGFCDSYTLQLDLGQGAEPVIYLRIDLSRYE